MVSHFKVRELPVNHTGVVSQPCIISSSSGVAVQSSVETATLFFLLFSFC